MINYNGHTFLSEVDKNSYIAAKNKIKTFEGINYNLNDRWEKGVVHHPKTLALMKRVSELDFFFNSDYFCWKMGGDGDNGEALAFVLDLYFEEEEILKKVGIANT